MGGGRMTVVDDPRDGLGKCSGCADLRAVEGANGQKIAFCPVFPRGIPTVIKTCSSFFARRKAFPPAIDPDTAWILALNDEGVLAFEEPYATQLKRKLSAKAKTKTGFVGKAPKAVPVVEVMPTLTTVGEPVVAVVAAPPEGAA